MPIFRLRVTLPDRPGALGAVASRVGALRGDVVGLDILERTAGRAVDELTIELSDASVLGLLRAEVSEVDGVVVEDIRLLPPDWADPRLLTLEAAARLVEETEVGALMELTLSSSRDCLVGEWASIVDVGSSVPRHLLGDHPPQAWLSGFVRACVDSPTARAGNWGSDDVAWAVLEAAGMAIVVGRRNRSFRARERRELACLARIADRRWAELALLQGDLTS